MKRILCAVLALAMIAGFAGCKQETAETEPILASSEEFTEETTEETEEEPTEEVTEEETTEPTETTEETVPPCENHSWGYWVQLEAPTTSAEGQRVRTCTVCGTEDVETIAKLPKTSSHKHKYKRETAKATCEEDGWVYFYCSCGDWYQVEQKATGHDWGDWTFKPRATGEGTTATLVRKCKNTGCKETETKTVEYCGDGKHDFGKEQKKDPTCVKAGYYYKACKDCGYIEKGETIPATGKHTYGDWKVVTPATATSEGLKRRTCTVCKTAYEEKTIPKKSHTCDYKEVVTKEATCTEAGEKQEVCSICGKVKTTTAIPALDHDWGDWVANEDHTKEVRKCQREGCSATEEQNVQATPGTPEGSNSGDSGGEE